MVRIALKACLRLSSATADFHRLCLSKLMGLTPSVTSANGVTVFITQLSRAENYPYA